MKSPFARSVDGEGGFVDATDGCAVFNRGSFAVLVLGGGRDHSAVPLADLDPDNPELSYDLLPAAIEAKALPLGDPNTERRGLGQNGG